MGVRDEGGSFALGDCPAYPGSCYLISVAMFSSTWSQPACHVVSEFQPWGKGEKEGGLQMLGRKSCSVPSPGLHFLKLISFFPSSFMSIELLVLPGLYMLDARSTALVVMTKNVSTLCQISPGDILRMAENLC